MASFWKRRKWSLLWPGSLFILTILLIGCGGASRTATTSQQPASVKAPANQSANQAADSSNSSTGNSNTSNNNRSNKNQNTAQGKQYLVKSLKLTMQVKDTRKVAVVLQQWMTGKDQNITSNSTTYQQYDGNNYSISLTYSVPSMVYPDVYAYLRDYTTQNGGRLTEFTETVQDVTNNYIDVESRLDNLRKEQTRLQDLLSRAQSLSDILTIESKLTEVEGNIESYEAQHNALTSQVSFYTITINLNPPTSVPQQQEAQGWSIWQAVQDAFKASLAFGQGLLTVLIWLLSFSLYLLPVAAIAWFVQRWRRQRQQGLAQPKAAFSTGSTPPLPPIE